MGFAARVQDQGEIGIDEPDRPLDVLHDGSLVLRSLVAHRENGRFKGGNRFAAASLNPEKSNIPLGTNLG